MPTQPLGTFNFDDVAISVGLDFEGDFCAVHVRVSWDNVGVALVVIGLDRYGQTYRLLVPTTRVRRDSPGGDHDHTFTLHALPIIQRRRSSGPLFRALVTSISLAEVARANGIYTDDEPDEEADPLRRVRRRTEDQAE